MYKILKSIAYFPIKFVLKRLKKLFPFFNLFYAESFYKWHSKQLSQVPENEQIFFITRRDFGTFLMLTNYVSCWQQLRGPTCLVVLTVEYEAVQTIAKSILPNTRVICHNSLFFQYYIRFFGKKTVQYNTVAPTYAKLICEYPNGLIFFEQMLSHKTIHKSDYISYFDKNLSLLELKNNPLLQEAYKKIRKSYDCKVHIYHDYIDLYYNKDLSKPFFPSTPSRQTLLKKLHINGPYVVLNVNCRHYFNGLPKHIAGRKRIQHPERYNTLIDSLIDKGFFVVLQGREEQPYFRPRAKFIDYSKNALCSLKNDIELFSECSFAVTSKNGPENFSTICNTPMLALNYTELTSMTPHLKSRFFPKQVRNLDSGKLFTWRELLNAPFYYDIGATGFCERIEYQDLTEEELLSAVEEFLPLANAPVSAWKKYTQKQQAFKDALHPAHLDLYQIKSVPLNCYLTSS
ncbi:MAG: TIGR04372 family glycosyltransferase [Chlamydiales bacterium]|nr:TIGR04372 family glycosyltransferase [Chlamydiales bacterium]